MQLINRAYHSVFGQRQRDSDEHKERRRIPLILATQIRHTEVLLDKDNQIDRRAQRKNKDIFDLFHSNTAYHSAIGQRQQDSDEHKERRRIPLILATQMRHTEVLLDKESPIQRSKTKEEGYLWSLPLINRAYHGVVEQRQPDTEKRAKKEEGHL